ncbi:corrinoid protein [Clostridium cellulovorans]|uniref:Methionine synthase B12-binding module cap domain protein n=1 Tax=Clostridium cellulovorans (strain ATCC 35296 / DSM 3052 / OCM 3 / 743B) TaxID=573061 RepID=D9SUU8_CLOC7|nr:corrinoid protein [Clostridium cellulovorans]ADL51003.1 Methionine synthase B12-binding module cap domain protein [Clostridium cellulovorans 743B]
MSTNKEELLKQIAEAVVEMDEEVTVTIAEEIIKQNFDAYEAIDKGLSKGMERAGELFDEEEYFIPELLLCSDAMYAGVDVLKPHIKVDESAEKHTVVIGVMEGDTHDIGKNLVKIMLETSGFEVVDLGRDVAPVDFVNKAKEVNAEIIALSTLMTTTMEGMQTVIELLKSENIRDRFKVMIGGGPISQSFADKIEADGYSTNAAEAVKLAKKLINVAI